MLLLTPVMMHQFMLVMLMMSMLIIMIMMILLMMIMIVTMIPMVIHRWSIDDLSMIYRCSLDDLSMIYRWPIDISMIYRWSIGDLCSKISPRTVIGHYIGRYKTILIPPETTAQDICLACAKHDFKLSMIGSWAKY